jgi:Ni/Fe-hydrogenase subunit HybB-like protein
MLGLQAPAGAAYFPHWIELVISLAAIVAGVLIFGLAARFLPIFHDVEEVEARALPEGELSGAAGRKRLGTAPAASGHSH